MVEAESNDYRNSLVGFGGNESQIPVEIDIEKTI